jgi:hypothetical protein
VPKRSKIEALDQLATLAIRIDDPVGGERLTLPRGFFTELVHGGLLVQILRRTKSKHALTPNDLKSRALVYRPVSAWHLHCDAVEAASWCDDAMGNSWTDVRQISASRIQELLHGTWNPRSGSVYAMLPSRLKSRWASASPVERRRITSGYARLKPNLFDQHFRVSRIPDWRFLGIDQDVPTPHMHKLLFAIAADEDFLQGVALSAWSMDMASAGLAAIASAWSERYLNFGGRIETDARFFWAGFDCIFFGRGHMPAIERTLDSAMVTSGLEPTTAWRESLLRGRNAYQRELRELGLSFQEIREQVACTFSRHPLEYRRVDHRPE